MHRFFVSPDRIRGEEVFFPEEIAHQLSRVLRLRDGDRVVVLDDSGAEYDVSLHSFGRRAVQGTIQATRPAGPEPRVRLSLFLALLKGKKLDLVLQKGTELGVARFVPMLSRRSVVNSLDRLRDAKLERWASIVREAAEQSGRGRLPEIAPPLAFDDALDEAQSAGGAALIAWEAPGGQTLREALSARPARVSLFIGPEGGFEADEVAAAQARGIAPVTFGPRILRAETAAVAGAAAILYELGEWERS